jgi:hypothetical protein
MLQGRDPVIHLYALCWNEARILPFFLRHYRGLADHIYVFDNGSTDQSVQMFAAEENVTVSHFDITGDSFVDEARRMCDTMWQASRGLADWVIVVDMDEHLFHPNLRGYLRYCAGRGITAISTVGYEMVGDTFPIGEVPLWQEISAGCRFGADFDKLCIFDPDAISSVNFEAGRHSAAPEGRVVYPERTEVKLLHFKKLGVDYLTKRWAELQSGLRPGDIANNWGSHYLSTTEAIESDMVRQLKMSRSVPGLSARNDVQQIDLHLDINGERIDPERVDGSRHIFQIPSQATVVSVVSGALNSKHALLGAPVAAIVLQIGDDRHEISLEDAALVTGWWGPTAVLGRPMRWTDGHGVLRLPSTDAEKHVLEIELVERMIRAWA